MKVTIISGARPNFMKIAPICRAIDSARKAGKDISYRVIYTGPQDDVALEPSLFSDLAMPVPNGYLGVSGHEHSQVAAAIMLAFEKELDNHPYQGQTRAKQINRVCHPCRGYIQQQIADGSSANCHCKSTHISSKPVEAFSGS